MSEPPWVLLFRIEDGQRVWNYGPLWDKQVKRMQLEGWRISEWKL